MVFDLKGKIALVTGGASGIGLNYSKELLKNGAKAVCLADVNPVFGEKAVKEIEQLFGANSAIFVKTDVTDIKQFRNAFEKTVEKFKHVDILINNAGVLNDSIWEKQIAINLNGTIHGILLGFETFLPKYKQGEEALIVNISSIAGLAGFAGIPVYTATKHAIVGLTKSWGTIKLFERTKVRVIAICPGVTSTPLITEIMGRTYSDEYETVLAEDMPTYPPIQQPEYLAAEAMNVLKYAPNGTLWVIESGEPAYEYKAPERFEQKGNRLPSK